MSKTTEKFAEIGRPFRAAFRQLRPDDAVSVVRDKHGYEICVCDDEDAAHAIAEALNEIKP